MRNSGQIIIKGIVQGVGFRPFVYSQAIRFNISGNVKNLGSEVRINAFGDNFEDFLCAVSKGTPLSKIDSVTVLEVTGNNPGTFYIEKSSRGELTGFIPPDVAICDDCISDIFQKGGRYENYWATSCVNCGPRYSIISDIPYDRERTTMDKFPMCKECLLEYESPKSRRHHAQTIACSSCGPGIFLLDKKGEQVCTDDPVKLAASLLDKGHIVAIRGIGGFHISCIESSAGKLKECLGRTEQPLAIMAKETAINNIAYVTPEDKVTLNSPEHPIVVLNKKDHGSHPDISNMNTIGCMLPYTGLHHLLFSKLKNPLLIMTSANAPGNPMVTETDMAVLKLNNCVDYFLTHNRFIQNRCDDSVVREGYIIRMSRGYAPKRKEIDLGNLCILGTGPELNSNISIYKSGFCYTSPHVGNVRNPPTLRYLAETVENIGSLTGANYDIIAHDMHPQFLSTKFAKEMTKETGAETVAVQHHRAHIAAAVADKPDEPVVGIATDGVGLGDDGKIWGGEIFSGVLTDLRRVAHLENVMMPGGDLATKFPERMLYGIMPEERVKDLLISRGWGQMEINLLEKQVEKKFNVAETSSTGRILDAASALLGICREKTFDGEPAMKLESAGASGKPDKWDLTYYKKDGCRIFSTKDLIQTAFDKTDSSKIPDIAASFEYNLARGIAKMAVDAANEAGIHKVALSGGVAYNHLFRETIKEEIISSDLEFIINSDYPLGDGCISFGQCIIAGMSKR
ncbi:carbamoyltransferase HypF [Methanoplanus sp. FWC-SCC4]|uniref:Carbamoyltransferase n=1 Tax=Methanochimaera problematica TaxID=2609417 RepID=A0AA97I3H1_9EURY|nr:carbamoyltransferase HypF [Methanoplanus sp. FWC-SCC4]WOF15569.1 carbamoyltransferase HypF [Methanoplanus sp. FWC-SCC4]